MTRSIKHIFAANLKYYMTKKGISRQQLVADLDFKYMTVSDWIHGKSFPRIDKLGQLAAYLNVSIADLITNRPN